MIRFRLLLIFYFIVLWSPLKAVPLGDFLKPVSAIVRKAIDRMTLPFPYSETLTARQATFVHENFYTVLNDGAKEVGGKYAIVGILRPCFFIGIRNPKKEKSIIFHKTASSSLASLVKIAKSELTIDDETKKSIIGYIFSNRFSFCDDFSIDGARDFHQGKTHEEEMKFIKNFLMSSFGISNEEQLECQIFKNRFNRLASLSVLVNSELKLNSICLAREKIFGEFSKRDVLTEVDERTLELWQIYFGDVAFSYNSVRFERAPLHYF